MVTIEALVPVPVLVLVRVRVSVRVRVRVRLAVRAGLSQPYHCCAEPEVRGCGHVHCFAWPRVRVPS